MTRLKCCACQKWGRRSPKCCACHDKGNASSENVAIVLRLPHKNHVWHVVKHVGKCHEVPRLPCKTTCMTACFETFEKVLQLPLYRPCDGTTEAMQLETRHVGASKRAFRARRPQISHFAVSKSTFSYEVSYGPIYQRFVRGFRRFSWHVTKCHACHGLCTLSPLRAVLTLRFAENTQHDTSKVLSLPKMRYPSEVSKVLRLPR